jgi:hypothetical protein
MNKQNAITTRQKFVKIVRWSSIIFLCLWVLIPVLGGFVPLELRRHSTIEYIYEWIYFHGFPIAAILLTLTWIKRKDRLSLFMAKIILAICVAVISGIIAGIVLFSDMCAWTTRKTLFENKQNSSIKIVLRSYGCGATDSSYPTYETFKIREITSDIIWGATEIDTNQINKNEWRRIEDKNE